jgi:hypothetical protein
MSLVCPVRTSLTDSELNQVFGNGTNPGVLPSSQNGSSDRESNGMLKQNVVATIVSSLKNSGIIPTATPTNAEAYITKVKSLLNNIQSEYCFYDSRYKYALEKLFDAVRQGYLLNTANTRTSIEKYLTYSQALNRRLNDLTQIINGITEDMFRVSGNLEAEINQFNNKIKEQQLKLEEQNKIISSSEAVTRIKKDMVKYTEEKARNTDNLLKLYSFLNVVALGLLVYVYKAASS